MAEQSDANGAAQRLAAFKANEAIRAQLIAQREALVSKNRLAQFELAEVLRELALKQAEAVKAALLVEEFDRVHMAAAAAPPGEYQVVALGAAPVKAPFVAPLGQALIVAAAAPVPPAPLVAPVPPAPLVPPVPLVAPVPAPLVAARVPASAHLLRTRVVAANGADQAEGEVSEIYTEVDPKIRFKCALTRLVYVDPQRLAGCGHTFSKSGLLNILKKSRQAENKAVCPAVGCKKPFKESDLIPDEKLAADIARYNSEQSRSGSSSAAGRKRKHNNNGVVNDEDVDIL